MSTNQTVRHRHFLCRKNGLQWVCRVSLISRQSRTLCKIFYHVFNHFHWKNLNLIVLLLNYLIRSSISTHLQYQSECRYSYVALTLVCRICSFWCTCKRRVLTFDFVSWRLCLPCKLTIIDTVHMSVILRQEINRNLNIGYFIILEILVILKYWLLLQNNYMVSSL